MKALIEVDSRKKAWEEVDRLFNGDYIKDEVASMNAGYTVFVGTLGGWISDLGNRLEIVDGKTFKSTNVWICEVWE